MGVLQFYYDKIILEHFTNSDENEFLLNEWDPAISSIDQTNFYRKVSEEIMKTYLIIYEKELKDQIWKVIRSLRRIILQTDDIRTQFEKLCEINKTLPEQRTPEWYAFRENLITASSWGNVFGWIGSAREVLLQKLGHEASQFKGNEFTRWGTKYEPVATMIYEKRTGKKVTDFGCLRHPSEDNFFIGASPDGISDDGVMLEIKCPPKRTIGQIPPNYYWAQMQGQLEVCDLERCDFLECKFEEYDDEDAYLEDVNENGPECGVVLSFKNKDDIKHIYSTMYMKGKELTDWMVKHIREYNKLRWDFQGASYWKISVYQVLPVFRDREWFVWARDQLKLFYDQWQFYKKHGYESLLSERQIKPKSSGIADSSLTDYDGFIVTSPQGDETAIVVKKLSKFGFSVQKADSTPVQKDVSPVDSDEDIPPPPKKFGFSTPKSEATPLKKFGFSTPKAEATPKVEEKKFGFTNYNDDDIIPPKKFGFTSLGT